MLFILKHLIIQVTVKHQFVATRIVVEVQRGTIAVYPLSPFSFQA